MNKKAQKPQRLKSKPNPKRKRRRKKSLDGTENKTSGGTAAKVERELSDTVDHIKSRVHNHESGFADAQKRFLTLMSSLKDGETLNLSIELPAISIITTWNHPPYSETSYPSCVLLYLTWRVEWMAAPTRTLK